MNSYDNIFARRGIQYFQPKVMEVQGVLRFKHADRGIHS